MADTSVRQCSIDDCAKPHKGRGYCEMHLRRLRLYGDPHRVLKPSAARIPGTRCGAPGCERERDHSRYCSSHRRAVYSTKGVCVVDGCDRPKNSRGMCVTHATRARSGQADPWAPIKPYRKGHLTAGGYRRISVDGRSVLEHRYVIESAIGRRLLSTENVHHINGDKLDNRLENLELWSTSQPKGQRVVDKLAWAREFVAMYEGLTDGI